MSDLLSYQPSNSAVYYVPSKRIKWGRFLIGAAGASVAIAVGAALYAWALPHLTSYYTRVGAVITAATAVGLLALWPVRYGQVRRPIIAATIGAILSFLAVYAMWVVWVHNHLQSMHIELRYSVLVQHPQLLLRIIRGFDDVGTWSIDGDIVRGVPLLVFWLVEAGAIVVAGVLIPIKGLFSGEPTCHECGSRCVPLADTPRFAIGGKGELVAAVEARDFISLASFPAPAHLDDPKLSIRLMSCSGCGKTHVLTISQTAWYLDANRRLSVKTTALVNQLLVTADEAEEIKIVCAAIKSGREAANAAETDGEEAPNTDEGAEANDATETNGSGSDETTG